VISVESRKDIGPALKSLTLHRILLVFLNDTNFKYYEIYFFTILLTRITRNRHYRADITEQTLQNRGLRSPQRWN